MKARPGVERTAPGVRGHLGQRPRSREAVIRGGHGQVRADQRLGRPGDPLGEYGGGRSVRPERAVALLGRSCGQHRNVRCDVAQLEQNVGCPLERQLDSGARRQCRQRLVEGIRPACGELDAPCRVEASLRHHTGRLRPGSGRPLRRLDHQRRGQSACDRGCRARPGRTVGRKPLAELVDAQHAVGRRFRLVAHGDRVPFPGSRKARRAPPSPPNASYAASARACRARSRRGR
jgi:hypothetical protein